MAYERIFRDDSVWPRVGEFPEHVYLGPLHPAWDRWEALVAASEKRVVAHPDNWEAAQKKADELGLKVQYDENCSRTRIFIVTPEEELPDEP
jgi:hypothetical protein